MNSAKLLPLVVLFGCATLASPRRFPPKAIELTEMSELLLSAAQSKFDERVKAGDKTIFFRINSPGGEVDSSLEFMKHVRDAKVRVICAVDWQAASMAFFFFENVCHDRLMTYGSYLGTHHVHARMTGNPTELRQQAEQLVQTENAMVEQVLHRTGISRGFYDSRIANSDIWFIPPEEAVRLHAADGMVEAADLPEAYALKAPEDAIERALKALGGSLPDHR